MDWDFEMDLFNSKKHEVMYEVPTSAGNTRLTRYIAVDADDAERVCRECERLGYRIAMVN